MIQADSLVYEYTKYDEEGNAADVTRAVNDVSLDIQKGDFQPLVIFQEDKDKEYYLQEP